MPLVTLVRSQLVPATRLPRRIRFLEDDLVRAMAFLATGDGGLAARAHNGDALTLTASGAARYLTGPWAGSQALFVEEAGANAVVNPSFEVDLSSWTIDANGGAAGGSIAQSALQAKADTSSALLTVAAQNRRMFRDLVASLSPNTAYRLSGWAYISAYTSGAPKVLASGNGWNGVSAALNTALLNQWQRVSNTCTTVADLTAKNCYFQVEAAAWAGSATHTVYWDALQLEPLAYATSYLDGAQGTGYAWSGTAHASSSTRAATYAYARLPSLPRDRGALFLFAAHQGSFVANAHLLTIVDDAGTPFLRVGRNGTATKLGLYDGATWLESADAGNLPLSTWTAVYADWQPGAQSIRVGTAAAIPAALAHQRLPTPATLYLGADDSAGAHANAALAAAMLFNRPLSADEQAYLRGLDAPPSWEVI